MNELMVPRPNWPPQKADSMYWGIPTDLGNVAPARLFQPSPSTCGLLRILLRATGRDRPGASFTGVRRVGAVAAVAERNYSFASLLNVIPGAAVITAGILGHGWTRIPMLAAGVLLAIVSWTAAMPIRLTGVFIHDVPANSLVSARASVPTQ